MYTELSRNEIRLLRVQRVDDDMRRDGELSNDNGLVQCDLHVVILDNAPPFEALSYTWGNQKVRKDVIINSQTLSVTAGLEAFLRRYRRDDKKTNKWLWVDAVCIDQSDDDERTAQVTMMSRIYGQCRSLLIWLGEGTEASDRAVGALQGLVNSEKLPLTERDAGAVRELFHHPWWERIWVVQEVQLGTAGPSQTQNALFICGDVTIPFTALKQAVEVLQSSSALNVICQSLLDHVTGLLNQECAHPTEFNSQASFLALLAQHRDRQATDPRDKVYGLLGLAESQSVIQPIYKKPLDRLLEEVARYLVASTYTYKVLRQCQLPDEQWISPSWAPNWEFPLSTDPIYSPLLSKCRLEPTKLSKGQVMEIENLHSKVRHPDHLAMVEERMPVLHAWARVIATVDSVCNYVFPATRLGHSSFRETPHVAALLDNIGVCARFAVQGMENCAAIEKPDSARLVMLWQNLLPHLDAEPKRLKTHCLRWLHQTEETTYVPTEFLRSAAFEELGSKDGAESDLDPFSPLQVDEIDDAKEKLAHEGLWRTKRYSHPLDVLKERTVYYTDSGSLGLGSAKCCKGDTVAFIETVDMPLVLRPHPQYDDTYAIVGETYVHDIATQLSSQQDLLKESRRLIKLV